MTCIDTSTEEGRYHTAELQCFLLNKSIRAAFFRFVMVMTSFDSLLDQCTCFRTCQTAYLSRSSPGVGFHPNHHPNQGFIRVYVICFNCVNWFQNRTVLCIIAHYLQPSPTSSPVSRTNPETFMASGFFYCAKRLRKQNLQTSRSFRIDLPRGIIYNWIAYHLRCNRRHVAHHPIDKGGFIP